MKEKNIFIKKTMDDYSDELKRLIIDIGDELSKGIKDGFGYKIANMDDNEAGLYSFLKNQGYDLNYKEFLNFLNECKELIEANEMLLDEISLEGIDEELNEDELATVSGGKGFWKKNWKKIAVGVGVSLVVGAAIVLTGGVGAVVVGAMAMGAPAGFTMLAVAGATANATLVTGCAIAGVAGATSIAAGAVGSLVD